MESLILLAICLQEPAGGVPPILLDPAELKSVEFTKDVSALGHVGLAIEIKNAVASPTQLTLSSSTARFGLPATYTIPAGAKSVEVPVSLSPGTVPERGQAVVRLDDQLMADSLCVTPSSWTWTAPSGLATAAKAGSVLLTWTKAPSALFGDDIPGYIVWTRAGGVIKKRSAHALAKGEYLVEATGAQEYKVGLVRRDHTVLTESGWTSGPAPLAQTNVALTQTTALLADSFTFGLTTPLPEQEVKVYADGWPVTTLRSTAKYGESYASGIRWTVTPEDFPYVTDGPVVNPPMPNPVPGTVDRSLVFLYGNGASYVSRQVVTVGTRFYDVRNGDILTPTCPAMYLKAGVLGGAWMATVRSMDGTVQRSVQGSGKVDFAWNGTSGGAQAPNGQYTLQVEGTLGNLIRRGIRAVESSQFLALCDVLDEERKWFDYHVAHVRQTMARQFLNPIVLVGDKKHPWSDEALNLVKLLLTQVKGFYFYGHGLGTANNFGWANLSLIIDGAPVPEAIWQFPSTAYVPSLVSYGQMKFVFLNACNLGCNHDDWLPGNWSLKWSDAFRQDPDSGVFIAWNGYTEMLSNWVPGILGSYTYYWDERFLSQIADGWPIDTAFINAIFGIYPNTFVIHDPKTPWRFIARNGWQSLSGL